MLTAAISLRSGLIVYFSGLQDTFRKRNGWGLHQANVKTLPTVDTTKNSFGIAGQNRSPADVKLRQHNVRPRWLHSQGLVRLETIIIDDVLSPLGHRLDLPQGARLTPLEVLRVHGDNVAALVLLGRHQQLHRGLTRE